MSKPNPLGLLGQYGYSDDDSDQEELMTKRPMVVENTQYTEAPGTESVLEPATIHPTPVPHCPWSACYDETSGYTYYWNHLTNSVTWEPPPEYLLALKLAQQHLQVTGNSEVSAEEWQLYQQVLADQKNSHAKSPPNRSPPKGDHTPKGLGKDKLVPGRKRKPSDSDDEKIELITSFQHSDSEDEETESPVKAPAPPQPPPPSPPKVAPTPKVPPKKAKTKPQEFGPTLPPNQNYSIPIGPEMPPDLSVEKRLSPVKVEKTIEEAHTPPPVTVENDNNDSPVDEDEELFKQLKDKTALLEKLGGEIPSDVQNLIKSQSNSGEASPEVRTDENSKDSAMDIDDLLEQIESKELKKLSKSSSVDILSDHAIDSGKSTPKEGTASPVVKPLFPSSTNISETVPTLFPSATNIVQNGDKIDVPDINEVVETQPKKKLKISKPVLTEKKRTEVPSYTTKYSQYIDGFSGERTGLGFDKYGFEEDKVEESDCKETVVYGKDLVFTKGEVLNTEKTETAEVGADDLDLLEAKLKFLNEQQPYAISPVQEMAIQLQTLSTAHKSGALSASYWLRWRTLSARALARLELGAAPAGWLCHFHRAEARYGYRREADGHWQWDYPAAHDDMDICTTPTPDEDVQEPPPPLPPGPPPPPPDTPPPPPWIDPPPPGTDVTNTKEVPQIREQLGDELVSFYNDIAEMEKEKEAPPPPHITEATLCRDPVRTVHPELKKVEKEVIKVKKKTKVKLSSSIGPKNKSMSSLVAKWQQVAEEIHSE